MAFVARILVAVIGLTNVLLSDGLQCGRAKAKAGEFGKRESFGRKACPSCREVFGGDKTDIYLLSVSRRSRELEGYAGSQVGGTGTYRLIVDAQGTVTQVTILKGFTVTAIYDERFSNVKGSTVPALDKVMVQALMRWRAKPGPTRVVDIYWSFGTHPWVNYGKSNVSQ